MQTISYRAQRAVQACQRHDHVLRDARKMLAELHGEGGLPSFGATLVDPQNGQEYPVLRPPKRVRVTAKGMARLALVIAQDPQPDHAIGAQGAAGSAPGVPA